MAPQPIIVGSHSLPLVVGVLGMSEYWDCPVALMHEGQPQLYYSGMQNKL